MSNMFGRDDSAAAAGRSNMVVANAAKQPRRNNEIRFMECPPLKAE
jgi:hypothetical protein